MKKLSLLDLVPIREGEGASEALAHAAAIAAHVEALGFHRYWVAEHHGMPGIGGAATSVALAHVGAATSTIRIGSGGIMLPNHAPLAIAEQFGTLDALFPGRIDLGVGRAPGSDQLVAHYLRRTLQGDVDRFPNDVVELQAWFAGDPQLRVIAVPGAGARVEMWMLGSSTYGAQLAAMLGLPYAFASHFAPAMLDQALSVYRERFQPSAQLDRPHVMVAAGAFAADTEAEAHRLASSWQQGFVALRTDRPGKLSPPIDGYYESQPPELQRMLDKVMRVCLKGTGEQVEAQLRALIAQTGADEIILASQIFDQDARKRSLEIVAQAMARIEASVIA